MGIRDWECSGIHRWAAMTPLQNVQQDLGSCAADAKESIQASARMLDHDSLSLTSYSWTHTFSYAALVPDFWGGKC
jgi:hypothetical protein